MWAKSSTGRTQPSRREISITSSTVPSSRTRPITSTPNGTARSLPSSRSRSSAELLDDGVDRVRALAAEQEARVEDDDLGARRDRDSGRVVEHPDRHPLLLVPLDVAHEAGDRRVDGERDAGLAGELAEALGPRVVHPELLLEVDLAGGVTRARAEARRQPQGSPGREREQGRNGALPSGAALAARERAALADDAVPRSARPPGRRRAAPFRKPGTTPSP